MRTGRVFAHCGPRRRARDLERFMEALARRYPTGDVYVVWDNLNLHTGARWARFAARHSGRFHFVHTPLHASWVNQVEIWFSLLARRVLRHASFAGAADLSARARLRAALERPRGAPLPVDFSRRLADGQGTRGLTARPPMPKLRAEELDVHVLRDQIANYEGLEHLRMRRYGSTLIVESGPEGDPVRHLRFRRDTVHLWYLDIANHRGQWEPTPHRDQLRKLFDLVATTYGWVLTPIA